MWVESPTEQTVDLPYSRENEEAVLACCLRDEECVDEAATTLELEDFYDFRHRNLFKVLLSLREQRIPVNLLTIRDEAKTSLERGVDDVGGMAFLAPLPDQVPSPAALPYHVAVVSRKARLRRVVEGARQAITQATAEGDDDSKLDDAEQTLNSIINRSDKKGGEVDMKAVVREALDDIEQAFAQEGSCTGISTGFPALDRLTGGIRNGDMIVLAARPSMGKTSLAMSIVENVAMDSGIPVGVLSMEMTAKSLVMRMLASRSGIDGHSLITGTLKREDIQRLTVTAGKVANSLIRVDETPHLTPASITRKARRMVNKYGVKMLVVDYLQLMHTDARSKVEEVTILSASLKQLAKDMDVPVVVLSQLNRNVESQDRAPRLSDLRDSGSIEQDADLVMMLHRPDSSSDIMDVMVLKHRNGPTGVVELEFDKSLTKYRNPVWHKDESED